MKKILLQKVQRGKSQYYQVIEDGKVLCERKSDREYAAALVWKQGDKFGASSFFGRMDLVGKDKYQAERMAEGFFYALAVVKVPE